MSYIYLFKQLCIKSDLKHKENIVMILDVTRHNHNLEGLEVSNKFWIVYVQLEVYPFLLSTLLRFIWKTLILTSTNLITKHIVIDVKHFHYNQMQSHCWNDLHPLNASGRLQWEKGALWAEPNFNQMFIYILLTACGLYNSLCTIVPPTRSHSC